MRFIWFKMTQMTDPLLFLSARGQWGGLIVISHSRFSSGQNHIKPVLFNISESWLFVVIGFHSFPFISFFFYLCTWYYHNDLSFVGQTGLGKQSRPSSNCSLIMIYRCLPIPLEYFGRILWYMGRVKRIWYLLPMRAAKVQASLHIRAVSPEPPLLAHTGSESRGTFRQKARSLAPLNGWACAVKTCHDGMLEDTNSLDGAQIMVKSEC